METSPFTQHIGDRLPPGAGAFRRAWHNHGLSLALFLLFAVTMAGQTYCGWHAFNAQRRDHHQRATPLSEYVRSSHFGEATFENWESEFLQMAFYVLLTVKLYQRGSSESKRPDVLELVDLDPRTFAHAEDAPWPVRRGGLILTMYENSLSLAFGTLFVASLVLHAFAGARVYSEAQLLHGGAAVSVQEFIATGQFWFESFQNWQSEFLSLAAMVVLTIFLRQRGSPESKPVAAPIWETGD
jgi:hypothetical protein